MKTEMYDFNKLYEPFGSLSPLAVSLNPQTSTDFTIVYPETKIGGSARGLVFVYIFELLLLFRPLTIASMAHVVTDHCLDCKYTYCVDACPVDAFHQGPNQLFINPDTCIDCGACVSECPVGAIEVDLSLPEAEAHWIDKNKIASLQYPVITSSIEPLLGPRCIDPSA